jgi:transcriptional regulator with XRE-family HTH domain
MTYDFTILRTLRKKKGATIGELSQKCGVSYVALSKLERNQGNPELRTLDRISRALGLPTHSLLALAAGKYPVRAKEETRTILEVVDCRFVNLDGTRILFLKAPKGAHGYGPEFHQDDYEHCYVLEGRVRVTIRGTDYDLGPGEGLVWDCLFDHNYEALEKSILIVILIPKRP